MPTGIYDRSKSKPRARKSDKPQAASSKAASAAKKRHKHGFPVGVSSRKAAGIARKNVAARAATSSDDSLAAFDRGQLTPDQNAQVRTMVQDVLGHFPGEVVDAEVRSRTCAVEVSPNVYGWLAIQAKARGVGPDVLLEELVMRHIQLGLS